MIRFAALYCCLFLLSSWSYIAGQSLSLSGSGYDMHAELNWTAVPGADSYRIWTRSDGEDAFSLLATTAKLRRMHWTGRNEGEIARIQYVVEALSITQVVLATSDTIEVTIQELSDDAFLDMVQEYTFRYFYDYAHPVSGMARERLGSGDIVTAGGSGFGILAIITGIHRGFITREQGVDHLLKMVSFLQFADRFHGVYPHWMHGTTGDVIPFSTFDNGGDLVETAFLFQGLLCARQYFDRNTPKENALRSVITNLWESVEWDHYARNNSGVLYWHWSPQHQWQLNLPVRGYNEAMMVYLLAISSPTHSVPASYWHTGWAGGQYVNGLTWYGHRLFVGPPLGGPLFFAHYSFMGFDPRNKKTITPIILNKTATIHSLTAPGVRPIRCTIPVIMKIAGD